MLGGGTFFVFGQLLYPCLAPSSLPNPCSGGFRRDWGPFPTAGLSWDRVLTTGWGSLGVLGWLAEVEPGAQRETKVSRLFQPLRLALLSRLGLRGDGNPPASLRIRNGGYRGPQGGKGSQGDGEIWEANCLKNPLPCITESTRETIAAQCAD